MMGRPTQPDRSGRSERVRTGLTGRRGFVVAAAPSPVGPTTPATAWSGPLTMLVLLAGMCAATAIAFELTQALPIAAVGAAGH